jgi:Uma2 family endonuclease
VRSPRLIAQILSPRTIGFDSGEKFQRLKGCETLEVYILVNYRIPVIEVYRRVNDWKLELYIPSQIIHLEELDLKIDVEAVFRRVQF